MRFRVTGGEGGRYAAPIVSTEPRQWYAVMTETSREAWGWESLSDRDFEVYLPRLVEWVSHPRRGRYQHVEPFFPGYLFVHTAPQTEWHRILEAPFILGVVGGALEPAAARDGAVETLQRLSLEGDGTLWVDGNDEIWAGPLPRHRKNRAPFEANQPLRIEGGPLDGQVGLYVGGQGRRMKLLVDMFGRSVVKEHSEALVKPA